MNGFDTGTGPSRAYSQAPGAGAPGAIAAEDSRASSATPGTTPWFRMASGIEAGIVGGLAMLALQFSESLWDGRVWWEVPNLLGSTFYGPRAFRAGAGMATLAGLALHFVITGCLGGLFGLAFGGIQQRGRLVILGLAASVGWYNLANATFWPNVNPWVPAAAPRPGTVVSHVLLGACLGFMGQRSRFLRPAGLAGASGFEERQELASGLEPSGLISEAALISEAGFVSPDEMPLPNAQVAAAEETLAAERAQPPAVTSSDALE